MQYSFVYKVLERERGREREVSVAKIIYEGWNFNSGNYLFTTDTK